MLRKAFRYRKIILWLLPFAVIAFYYFKGKIMPSTLSSKGRRWLEGLEGKRYTSYKDTKGLDTTAVGTLIDTPQEQYLIGKKLTENEVQELYTKEVNTHKVPVDALIKDGVKLNQMQYDALVSLAFNAGVSGIKTFNIYKYIKTQKKDFDAKKIQDYWDNISYSNRRQAEIDLFLTGVYKEIYKSTGGKYLLRPMRF